MRFSELTAVEIGNAIANGEYNSLEVTTAFLDEIDASSVGDEIFVRKTPERALAEARASDARTRKGERFGVFDGVPVSWKDLFDVAGFPAESGAPLLKGRIPAKDAELVRRAAKAGMVCLGKTHQTEFAFSGLGINPNTATPPNRLKPGHVSGGSSSGAAASLSYGMSALAMGSDTGGSVRIPAAWNSLVGLKTTHGLLPTEGMVPLCRGFDTPGPICRSVGDAINMFDVLAGASLTAESEPSKPMKLAVVETIALEDVEAYQSSAFEDVVDELERSGVLIERIKSPAFALSLDLGAIVFPYEAWREWGELIDANPGVMYPPVEARFRQGMTIKPASYRAAIEELDDLRKQFFLQFAKFDGFLMPTTPTSPPLIEELLKDHEKFTAANLIALRNTRFANLLGTCALTIPTHKPAAGLQIIGKPRDERKLLAVGAALEAIIAERI